ncbi:unnamed protein product [Rotaria sp. Silwood2]|nr:unnamed protein product [Rotaria sp. Silwood2]CAF4419067.1 unnamed protein product [Rotaria sp. Silwood2]
MKVQLKIFSTRSGRQWTTEEPPKLKLPQANIIKHRSSVGRPATTIQSVKEAFQLLITEDMILLLTPGEFLTVDEQLIPTRGRCNFRQYIPSQPGKYGVKIFWCCDSSMSYPLNGEVYLGRQPEKSAATQATNRISNLVKRLVHPWINTGRTVTTDNYFTSVELAEDLLGMNTTLVGTMRRNKKGIPRELQPDRQRPEELSIFCFDRQLTLVSYAPKKRHAMILLSSMHHDKVVDNDQKNKPDIILYYNDTKGGVDRMDQMVQTYSCKRKTKRWPMTFFFNVLDVGGHELVDPYLNRRRQQPQALQKEVRLAMQTIGLPIITSTFPENASAGVVKRRCQLCSREQDRKVITHCTSCNISCCPDHHKVICNTCCETFLM